MSTFSPSAADWPPPSAKKEPRQARRLTARQLAMLRMIIRRSEAGEAPPTLRELGDACEGGSLSTSVVNYHLNLLRDRGLIIRDERVARGLRVTAKAHAEHPGLFAPPSTADVVLEAVREARAAGEALPMRVELALLVVPA